MEYYSAIKNEILPFGTTWMDLEGVILNEVSQAKTNSIWFHSYIEYKKQKGKTNEQSKPNQTNMGIEFRVVITKGDGGAGRGE